jgi:ribosomal protein S6
LTNIPNYDTIINMNYQLTFLVSLKLEADKATQCQEKIIDKLKKIGAEIKEISEIKEQVLVYAIRGEKKAWLANLVFSADPEKINEIRTLIEKDQNILRHLIFQSQTKKKASPRRLPKSKKEFSGAIVAPSKEEDEIKDNKGLDQKINEILDWE